MTITSRINEYRNAVTAEIKTRIPLLQSCETQFGRFNLDELETNIVKAPAVRFGVLSAKIKPQADAQASAAMNCAAFVITEGKDRDGAAWAIAEAIVIITNPPGMFGLVKLGAPSNVAILPVVDMKLKQRGVSVLAVEWMQELHQLGTNIFDDAGHLVSELYINDVLEPVDA